MEEEYFSRCSLMMYVQYPKIDDTSMYNAQKTMLPPAALPAYPV